MMFYDKLIYHNNILTINKQTNNKTNLKNDVL